MAIYREDIVDIDLAKETLHRDNIIRIIGKDDKKGNRFGVRVFRDGQFVDIESDSASVNGYFHDSHGGNTSITGSTYTKVKDNVAYVTLPESCYNYEGPFSLAIKLLKGSDVIGTVRIVDGIVNNTYKTDSTPAPEPGTATYDEVLAVYGQMQTAILAANSLMDGAVAKNYSSSATYDVGEYCLHESKLYRCSTKISTAELFTSSHWTACPSGVAGQVKATIEGVATAYSSSATYDVGDYVSYNRSFYRCTTPISTAEAFTSSHWSQVDVSNDLLSKIQDTESEIAPAYSGSTSYSSGEYCTYNGSLWRSKKDGNYGHTPPAVDYWTECSSGIAGQVKATIEGVAEAWEANHAYQVGDYVSRDRKFYRMTTQPTQPDTEWNSTTAGHWTQVDDIANDISGRLSEEITELNETVEKHGSDIWDLQDQTAILTKPVPNAQVLDISGLPVVNMGGSYGFRYVEIPVSDGTYYMNPIADNREQTPIVLPRMLFCTFLDSGRTQLTITRTSDNTVVDNINPNSNYVVLQFSGQYVYLIQYLGYTQLVEGSVHQTIEYQLSGTPAYMEVDQFRISNADYDISYAIGGITKDEWSTRYQRFGKDKYLFSDELVGMITENNDRLFSTVPVDPEGVDQFVQLVNPATVTYELVGNSWRAYTTRIPLPKDGAYYMNPGYAYTLYYISFYNKFGEKITFTRASNGQTVTDFNSLFAGGSAHGHIEISKNGRVLKNFVRYTQLVDEYEGDSTIAYMGGSGYLSGNRMSFSYPESDSSPVGITYGQSYDQYVQYTGDPETEYEDTYNPGIARYSQEYMKATGTAVSNSMFDFVYPETDDSVFSNMNKYFNQRFQRADENIIRFGTFNKFVSRGDSNWPTIKKELADYAIDICGFQECKAISSEGVVTDSIGDFLKGIQFPSHAIQDATVDKALVSHWTVATTNILNILTHDSGNSSAINGVINLAPYKWYSNAISNIPKLSVYVYHGSSSGKTIEGVSYSALDVRMMEIQNLLSIIAQDTADFIVILGDTNCFEPGFDTVTGNHAEWEAFRTAGYIPVLEGYESTVTGDVQDRMFYRADNGKIYCLACYDQIFIGKNITKVSHNVVDSNRYPVERLDSVPVSDHCMVYADLKFDFDAVMQDKLDEIAVDEPWW